MQANTHLIFVAMEVAEVITLSYKGGPKISVPASLIQHDQDGKRWLKFRPSNHTITKLVLGHMEDFKTMKNPSLATSPKLKEIQEKVKQAVFAAEETQSEGEGMFGDEQTEDGNEMSCKEKKHALQSAPASVKITLLEKEISVKTPSSWKQSDLLVPIDANTLTTLCDYIMEDVSGCLRKESKRSYQQTGKFKKKAKSQE